MAHYHDNPINMAQDAFEAVGREKLGEILENEKKDLIPKIQEELETHASNVVQDQKDILGAYAGRAEEAKNTALEAESGAKQAEQEAENSAAFAESKSQGAETAAQNAAASADTARRHNAEAQTNAQSAALAHKNAEALAQEIKNYLKDAEHFRDEIHQDTEAALAILNKGAELIEKIQGLPELDTELAAKIEEAKEIFKRAVNEIMPDLRREQQLADQVKDNMEEIRENLRDIWVPRAEMALQKLEEDILPRAEAIIGTDFLEIAGRIEAAEDKFTKEILPEAQRLEGGLAEQTLQLDEAIAGAQKEKNALVGATASAQRAVQDVADSAKDAALDAVEQKKITSVQFIEEKREEAKTQVEAKKEEGQAALEFLAANEKTAITAKADLEKEGFKIFADSLRVSRITFDPLYGPYKKGDILWLEPPTYDTQATPPAGGSIRYPYTVPAASAFMGKARTYSAQTNFRQYAVRLRALKDNPRNPAEAGAIGSDWAVDAPSAIVEEGSNANGEYTLYAGRRYTLQSALNSLATLTNDGPTRPLPLNSTSNVFWPMIKNRMTLESVAEILIIGTMTTWRAGKRNSMGAIFIDAPNLEGTWY